MNARQRVNRKRSVVQTGAAAVATPVRRYSRRRLADRQDQKRDHDARQADPDEHLLPGLHLADQGPVRRSRGLDAGVDRAADHVGESAAARDAGGVQADGAAQAVGREVVLQQRQRRRVQRRLAGADADARQEQRRVGRGEAAGHRHEAPDGDAGEDQPAAVPAIGEPGDHHPEEGVEHRERPAEQEAHLGVGDLQAMLDVRHQLRDHFAVDEREHVGQQQDHHHVPGIRGARVRHAGRGIVGGWIQVSDSRGSWVRSIRKRDVLADPDRS